MGILGLCLLVGCARPARRSSVEQPVQEYFADFRGPSPFRGVTHIASDYGPMGPGESWLTWRPGRIEIELKDDGPEWAGMWHSLEGLAREKERTLDFARVYPPWIRDEAQPRCTGLVVRAAGTGTLRIDIRSRDDDIIWEATSRLDTVDETRRLLVDCPTDRLPATKVVAWRATRPCRLSIDSIGLRLQLPPTPFEKRVFLTSYAKLSRCYVRTDGVVKDRAHVPAGRFCAVPASGMFCLATAAAWQLGIVDRAFAEETLHKVHRTMSAVPKARGLLPHFISKSLFQNDPWEGEAPAEPPSAFRGRLSHAAPVRGSAGASPSHHASDAAHSETASEVGDGYRIHGKTEFSTVDSALYYHGMLLAAEMLGERAVRDELVQAIRSIELDKLRGANGAISHGLRTDGRTLIRSSWTGWGGETALVLLLERIALGDAARPKMDRSGKVFRGRGFIAEVQSLFYPQFGEDRVDAVSGVNWLTARRALLADQMAYLPRDTAAATLGLYGLSAGEGPRGVGYVVNGTATRPTADLIHPHYVLMSGILRPPGEVYALLRAMGSRDLFPPWGMVENAKADLSEHHPMLGSLNAAFEALAAYHLWANATGQPDAIYDAARSCPPLARAIRAFYP